jgi:hypothetical protein
MRAVHNAMRFFSILAVRAARALLHMALLAVYYFIITASRCTTPDLLPVCSSRTRMLQLGDNDTCRVPADTAIFATASAVQYTEQSD